MRLDLSKITSRMKKTIFFKGKTTQGLGRKPLNVQFKYCRPQAKQRTAFSYTVKSNLFIPLCFFLHFFLSAEGERLSN